MWDPNRRPSIHPSLRYIIVGGLEPSRTDLKEMASFWKVYARWSQREHLAEGVVTDLGEASEELIVSYMKRSKQENRQSFSHFLIFGN